MAVIPFPQFQPQGGGETELWKQRTISTRQRSPLVASSRTLERPGSEWVCTPRFNNLDGMKRAVFQQFLANCRGFGSRFYLPTFYRNRGSFPAPELLTNNTFASGTTGWTAGNIPTPVLTASDGVLRVTDTGSVSAPQAYQGPTLAQYVPYAFRAILHPGRGASASNLINFMSDNTIFGQAVSPAPAVFVPAATTGVAALYNNVLTSLAGNFFEASFASAARCALVDNGPNHLLQASTIDNAAWTKGGGSITANLSTAPDGTATGDAFTENGAAGSHGYSQSGSRTSAAADLCGFGYFRRATGTRNVALYVGNDFSDYGRAVFDLGGGTVAAVGAAGAATNARAFVTPAGNGWYFCAVVARVPAAATILCQVNSASGTSDSYTGDGTSIVSAWRVGATVSSVPTRGAETVASALQTGTSQTGSALHLKGLPASANGLLLPGDWAEIITPSGSQAVRTSNPLNSDAAGLGYWQFEAPLRVSPSDNAGVIVCNPLIRASLDHRDVEWSEHDDGFSSLEFTAVEDLA